MAKTRTAEVDLVKLCSAIRSGRQVLEPFRAERREAVRKYAGDHWSSETSRVRRPVNFLSMYLSIVPRNLISHSPKFSLGTFERQYGGVALGLEKWGNREIDKMGLEDTLHRVVLDGLIGPMGIAKVCLATPADAEMSGWGLEFGQPYISCIDLDDFAIDPHAREIDKAAWMACRYRVMVDSLKDSKIYPSLKRKNLVANPDKQYNEPGDEKISMLQRQYVSNEYEEAYEYVDLWEVYLPRERLILTMQSEDGGSPIASDYKGEDSPFSQTDWVGPSCGPYHFLRYLLVPGQAISKGPIQDILDLDEELNGLTQKLMDQAARQKSILGFTAGSEADAQRAKEARDGDIVRFDNTDKLKPVEFGGPHAANQAFSMGLWDLLNKLSGNLELMAGLGAQSKTATQDKLLNANSSRSVTDMQQTTVKFTADVLDSWLWFAHHHPQKVMDSYHDFPGLKHPIKKSITPQARRQVPYDQMDLQVHPYSFQYQTPQEMMQFLDQTVMQIVTPLMPLMEKQGIFFDLNKYMQLKAKYGNSTDLGDVVRYQTPPAPDQQSGGDGRNDKPPMPVATTREYNRVNSSEATDQGQSKAMQQTLLGQNPGGSPSSNGVLRA